jgi:protoporphyrinogen oxidase
MKKVKYLIIGGGISGLTFANRIGSNDYLIIEKEKEVGGLCRTHYVGDYVWDYAGHFFHFANKDLKSYFENNLSRKDMVVCKKNTKILYKQSFVDYPFQKNIHQLPKDEFIECIYDLYFKNMKDSYDNFLDMLYGKFGKSITDKFLRPYNEKLYACKLNDLDTNSMGRFFPYAELDDVMRNMKISENDSYNSYFDYPKQGAQTIINILLKQLNEENIMLNSEVKDIDINRKILTVGDVLIKYEHLISTIPFNQLVRLCSLNCDINVLSANQVLVFNLGFDRKTEIKDYHWIYYPENDYIFYRVGFYDNILSSEFGSLYVEIGYPEKKQFEESEIEKILERVILDLKKANESLLINPGYVHITSESNELVHHIMNELSMNNVFGIGRYGSWTYCSMEDCMLQAIELAEKLSKA